MTEQAQAAESEAQGLAKGSPIVPVQRQQRRDRMVGDATVGVRGRATPPVHSVNMDLQALPEPRQQLLVSDFPAAMTVRINNITHQRDNGAARHGNSAPYGRQVIQVSIDSAGAFRLTTIRTTPRVQVMATDRVISALRPGARRTVPACTWRVRPRRTRETDQR